MRATLFLIFSIVEMNFSKTTNVKTYTVEQTRNSHCLSPGSDSLYLQFKQTIWVKVTHANTPTALPRFKNVIFRHRYVMQKNNRSIETEQRYLCRVLHFNRQNLMLISLGEDRHLWSKRDPWTTRFFLNYTDLARPISTRHSSCLLIFPMLTACKQV